MKKKNPFKMWGSWIGGGVGLIIYYYFSFKYCFNSVCDVGSYLQLIGNQYLALGIHVIAGFLLGWGIEVLLRKNKWFGLK